MASRYLASLVFSGSPRAFDISNAIVDGTWVHASLPLNVSGRSACRSQLCFYFLRSRLALHLTYTVGIGVRVFRTLCRLLPGRFGSLILLNRLSLALGGFFCCAVPFFQ